MGYKEKIQKYKDGTLSEDERRDLEQEMEKIREISDYIYGLELSESADFSGEREKSTEESLKNIRRSVSRRFLKAGVATGAIVIAIVMFLIFGLSPLMNRIYYDPSEAAGEASTVLDVPMHVFTELHCVDQNYSYALAKPEGFGSYSIKCGFSSGLQSSEESLFLNKGKFDEDSFYDTFKLNHITDDFEVTETYIENGKEVTEKRDDRFYVKELARLPESAYVKCAVNFKKALSLEELRDIMDRNQVYGTRAIAALGERKISANHLGFIPGSSGNVLEKDAYDSKQYPYLCKTDAETPKDWAFHFQNMLEYLLDSDDFMGAIPDGELQKEQYKEALAYIKKNGVKVYSLVTFASPENLRNMRKDSRVANISIMDVKVSEYSR